MYLVSATWRRKSVSPGGREGKEYALIPYAIVSSVKFSFSISFFMSAIGIDDPAAIPVLSSQPSAYKH